MLNLEKATRLFDALQYCNKHIVGIEKDYVSHFYKIKHAILAHIYKKPHILEGYTLKIDGMETSNEGELLSITIKSELQCYKFHVPFRRKTCKQFGLADCDVNCIGPYWASEKIGGDLATWMQCYALVREIAYSWRVLNPHEDRMKLATKYPNQWKQNWLMFVSAFNKRFKNKYLLRGCTDDKRKCEIIRLRDNRVMYCLWCFKLMKDCSYINYMNQIDKKIKWH
jgi:hypothetical protein